MDKQAALAALGKIPLPLPGSGATSERHRRLFDIGRTDLSVARLIEAHTDALAILAEANHAEASHDVEDEALYGVWASDGPASKVTATRLPSGQWSLSGTKQYCSGANFCTAALVTAHHETGLLLFAVPLKSAGVEILPSTWTSAAFADTATVAVRFERVLVAAANLLGKPDFYLTRSGFWHGALGPAACWAGGAASLADSAIRLGRKDPHSLAHLGALQASTWGLLAFLTQAGREIDADPLDRESLAQQRALKVRHLIERECTTVLDRFGRATGPQLLAFDAHAGQQFAALALYIRQCHGERDLEQLARAMPSNSA